MKGDQFISLASDESRERGEFRPLVRKRRGKRKGAEGTWGEAEGVLK